MLKTIPLTLLALVLAVGGGGVSVWWALVASEGAGSVTIGGWTASADAGGTDADPYARARAARQGALELPRAEGVTFVARADSSGERLRRQCRYSVEGNVPPARLWTLYASDETLAPVAIGERRLSALHSLDVLRLADNSLLISVSRSPMPGNWLAVSGVGPMALALTLYDTSIASSPVDVAMPQVLRTGCDG